MYEVDYSKIEHMRLIGTMEHPNYASLASLNDMLNHLFEDHLQWKVRTLDECIERINTYFSKVEISTEDYLEYFDYDETCIDGPCFLFDESTINTLLTAIAIATDFEDCLDLLGSFIYENCKPYELEIHEVESDCGANGLISQYWEGDVFIYVSRIFSDFRRFNAITGSSLNNNVELAKVFNEYEFSYRFFKEEDYFALAETLAYADDYSLAQWYSYHYDPQTFEDHIDAITLNHPVSDFAEKFCDILKHKFNVSKFYA